MDKIVFQPENGEPVAFFVLEQTRLNGRNYILVTDSEDGDGEALILKDLSQEEETEALYEEVSDETELAAVAGVFENLLDEITFDTTKA